MCNSTSWTETFHLVFQIFLINYFISKSHIYKTLFLILSILSSCFNSLMLKNNSSFWHLKWNITNKLQRKQKKDRVKKHVNNLTDRNHQTLQIWTLFVNKTEQCISASTQTLIFMHLIRSMYSFFLYDRLSVTNTNKKVKQY